MWRDDAYLLDMLLAARQIRVHVRDVTREGFDADVKLHSAVMHWIMVIGEAARHLSPEFQRQHPELPWSDIIGMRNKMVHEYFRVDFDVLWDAIHQDVPDLIAKLEPLVPPAPEPTSHK
jgi:uncharacterized protein with HEPN domain